VEAEPDGLGGVGNWGKAAAEPPHSKGSWRIGPGGAAWWLLKIADQPDICV
jgi:hypothetical protein